MNILITGGAGFIGSNLCARLLGQGHKVWAVDNLLTGNIDNILPLKTNPNFSFMVCGVEEQAFLDFCNQAGEKFDRVYHLACATGVPNIEYLGEEMLLACSIGTMNTLRVALKSNADLLFTSSSEAYGEPLESPQKEDYTGNVNTIGPRANYEEGKRFSETLLAHFVRRYGLRARMVRLFNVYGPNMALTDTRVVPQFAVQTLSGHPLTVQGDGSQIRTLCFVSDILDGFEAVISKGIPGQVYNLGSDQQITIHEFAKLMIKLANSPSTIQQIPRPPHDHSSRMPDLSKIKSLGWEMKVDLNTGLQMTLDNFKKRLTFSPAQNDFSLADNLQTQPQG